MSKDPKVAVKELVRLMGKPQAERHLITFDVSPSTAGKLVRGTYQCEVGVLMAAAILRARAAADKQTA